MQAGYGIVDGDTKGCIKSEDDWAAWVGRNSGRMDY